jgi:hypothetical protein
MTQADERFGKGEPCAVTVKADYANADMAELK